MGKTSDKIFLPAGRILKLLKLFLQVVRHMVKILRQLADLISGLHLCPHFQISARNAAGGSGQPSQRPEQPDRDQITAKPLQKQKPLSLIHIFSLFSSSPPI